MTLSVKASAKINLSLDLTGRCANGYHTIDSVMQSISLYDRVTLSTNPGQGIRVSCSIGPQNEENLCYRAAGAYFRAAGMTGEGLDVHIEKAIPLCAGLGGGSADAAAVLVGLDRLYPGALSPQRLAQTALELGADVPFFLKGGCCRATGIGERLEPVTPVLSYALVWVKTGEKSSTGDMYRALDECCDLPHSTQATLAALTAGDYPAFCRSLDNAFLRADPAAADVMRSLLSFGADGVNLSGSGPTVYGVFKTDDLADKAACALREVYPTAGFALPCREAMVFE